MLERARSYALIKLRYPDVVEAGFHSGIDGLGERYLCAFTDLEAAETHRQFNGLQPGVARVVEWPGHILEAFAKESRVFSYVMVDPPL